MPNRRRPRGAARPRTSIARDILLPETTVLDVLDHVLNKGVTATGDLTIGVAGVDLVYVRLSALLCAADRVMPRRPASRSPRARRPSRSSRPPERSKR